MTARGVERKENEHVAVSVVVRAPNRHALTARLGEQVLEHVTPKEDRAQCAGVQTLVGPRPSSCVGPRNGSTNAAMEGHDGALVVGAGCARNTAAVVDGEEAVAVVRHGREREVIGQATPLAIERHEHEGGVARVVERELNRHPLGARTAQDRFERLAAEIDRA